MVDYLSFKLGFITQICKLVKIGIYKLHLLKHYNNGVDAGTEYSTAQRQDWYDTR